jgi:hypothetical protein
VRNITKGQKAMAHAILFPNLAKLKRKGSGSLVTKEQFSEALLSQARAVLTEAAGRPSRSITAG